MTTLTKNAKYAFVDRVMKDVPNEVTEAADVLEREIQLAALSLLPDWVREVADRAAMRHYLRTESVTLGVHVVVIAAPRSWDEHNELRSNIKENPKVKFALHEWETKREARAKVEADLRAVVFSCRTLKQLRAALPELEEYMPTLPEAKNLPANTIMQDLQALGFGK